MKTAQHSFAYAVGIDVSKATLDIALPDESLTIKNTSEAIQQQFIDRIKADSVIVILEATGGYENQLISQLHKNDIALAIVNPRRVRDFAKGIGMDAKTDSIDAKVIAYYCIGFSCPIKPSSCRTTIKKASFDRGFYSKENEVDLIEIIDGLRMPPSHRNLNTQCTKNASIELHEARRRHSGIESASGALQSADGVEPCRDKSEVGFERYRGLALLGGTFKCLEKS